MTGPGSNLSERIESRGTGGSVTAVLGGGADFRVEVSNVTNLSFWDESDFLL